MPVWLPLAMAAAGALAGKAKNDRAQDIERSDRKLAAETQRYSPWTGMRANNIRQAGSQFGDMFSGGVGGAMMGQSLSNGMAGMSSGAAANPYDKATSGGFMGMGSEYDPNTAANYLPRSAGR